MIKGKTPEEIRKQFNIVRFCQVFQNTKYFQNQHQNTFSKLVFNFFSHFSQRFRRFVLTFFKINFVDQRLQPRGGGSGPRGEQVVRRRLRKCPPQHHPQLKVIIILLLSNLTFKDCFNK